MNRIHQLHQLGQSLWYDNIQRSLLETGKLAQLIEEGLIRGVTSNPSIFHNAIARSNDYDAALKPMAWSGWNAEQIFTQLAIEDIQAAADLFRSLYEETNAADGYVSLEVNPLLANDTEGTIAEAQRLWSLVNRPNLMIKIPATPAGIPAIRKTIAAGINVNVTLIFSLVRYAEVIDAYLSGLEDRLSQGLPVDRIASVASFFVSRVDTKVDQRLHEIIQKEEGNAGLAQSLLGKAAIANARLAYALYLEKFTEKRFIALREKGAHIQRPLWASTSTKNPAYRDVIYVEELIGPDTVNTVPPQTLEAFLDHGEAQVKLGPNVEAEKKVIQQLEELGISMEQVTYELEVEGVKAFADAFTALMQAIEQRRQSALEELGILRDSIPHAVQRQEQDQVGRRMFEVDPSLWTDDPNGQAEIRQRMGWLQSPIKSLTLIEEYQRLAQSCREDGLTHALLLGMGGSSLAPEVFRLTFGVGKLGDQSGLDLAILDSTDPQQVLEAARRAPIEQTLFIVSSKSGTTSEVNAFLDFFWQQAQTALGDKASSNFVAITDPGTPLEKLARNKGFRAVLAGDPQVGGRYSALTPFGLFPAALLGMNLETLLQRAGRMLAQSMPDIPAARNPGLVLGTILGEAALAGRDKLTILAEPPFESFGSWLEQLIAESTGKDGKGIVPVDLEPPVSVELYKQDRLFVYFRKKGLFDERADALRQAGHPVLVFDWKDVYDLGGEFYRWEIATAVASAILGINGFDQPDVQDNKDRTAQKIAEYRRTQSLDEGQPQWENEQGKVYGIPLTGSESASNLREIIHLFLRQAREEDYIAINAYLPRNSHTIEVLQKLRHRILEETACATTLGFGPRFLHSTGQLHKGGPDRALFLQITREVSEDVEIPGQGITFGILERAQALGDLEALLARQRRVIRIHLTGARIEDLI
ncbi:MAG: glucose-6-phosphate isomerase [Bellilinea sp.]|nr:MAG: glucose-6-phosphate isomerase [Bellilinea sp.]